MRMRNENKKYYKSYARLQRHIDKMMIIKVAADATVAIIITKFLSSSSDEFRLNLLSEFALAAIVEGVVVSAVAIGCIYCCNYGCGGGSDRCARSWCC